MSGQIADPWKHFAYDRSRSAGSHRPADRRLARGASPEIAHHGHGTDLLGGHGSARFRLSQHDGVSPFRWPSNRGVMADSGRITQENTLRQRFIGASDFLKNGIPASILATFVRDERLDIWGRFADR